MSRHGGRLYVISGPSGVGKSTLIRKVRDRFRDLGYSVSHTSRRPRKDEIEGISYHFVDRETFERMIDEGAFVEWARVFEDLYGTSISGLESQMEQGIDILMDLDSQGARNIKKRFKDSALIYLLPPSLEILERRLRDRAADEEKVIKTRIEKATRDLKNCLWYDYMLINDDLGEAFERLESIIIADRSRTPRMLSQVKGILGL